MGESRSDDSDGPDDSTLDSCELEESEVSDKSDVSSLLASTDINNSSKPDSDDPADVNGPEEESPVLPVSNEAGGNRTVLVIDSDEDTLGSDEDIQDRLVTRKKKGVCLLHSTRNLHVLTDMHRRPRKSH